MIKTLLNIPNVILIFGSQYINEPNANFNHKIRFRVFEKNETGHYKCKLLTDANDWYLDLYDRLHNLRPFDNERHEHYYRIDPNDIRKHALLERNENIAQGKNGVWLLDEEHITLLGMFAQDFVDNDINGR